VSLVRIPLVPRQKRPLPMGWQQLSPESPILRKVAESVPDCNWGMRLDNFVVADCDSPDAMEWWQQHCPVGSDLISVGRPGRCAYWYLRPPDTRLRTFRLRPDLEIRTGSGAQQVIPPSVHPGGWTYRWVYGSFEDYEHLPLAPEEWLFEQVPSEDIWAEGGGDGWELIPEGRRDIALTSLAGQLRRHGASRNAISHFLDGVNALFCRPKLPEEDLARIARSVSQYGVGERGRDVTVEWDDDEDESVTFIGESHPGLVEK
jgi:bifunctional DNA primase/polymerase-like protein/primase-like protein